MAASYPSSAKSFTTKTDGVDTNAAGDINALQDEVTAVESALLTSLAHDLKFTDATFDIGKSGATRPRDGFFSRNVTVGGTLTATGASQLNGAVTTNAIACSTLTPSSLIDISAAGAGQIKFPATQNASADANTLDDYTEVNWTPSVGGTATYTNQVGKITKVGRKVHLYGRVNINTIGTGNTGQVTGVPAAYASGAANMPGSVVFFSSATAYTYVACYINGTTVVFTSTAAAVNSMTNPAVLFGNGSDVYFTIEYSI